MGSPTLPNHLFAPWGHYACPKLEAKGGQAGTWLLGAPSKSLHSRL